MDSRLGSVPPPSVEYLEPEFERMSADELRGLQLKLFQEDFSRVRENRFFARWYSGGVPAPDDVASWDDIRRVPVVRKDAILADAASEPPYGTRFQARPVDVVEVVESSGTSGLGREVQALTPEDRELVIRAKMFQFFWPGCRRGTVVALHMPVSMAAGALWSLQALQRLESNVLRLGTLETEARVEYMRRYGVEVTAASTAYLMRLEHVAESVGMDIQRDFPVLKSIYIGSGGWTRAWAELRAARWNARLFEVYGSSQRAFAITCEYGILRDGQPGVMHFLPHVALTEVIDRETGAHVAPGEEGEIVVTPFGQRATPLIRYATGDRATYLPGGACPCGRAFDGLEAGSVGRYDDMLRLKEVNVWPETIDDVVLGTGWAADYRGDVSIGEDGRERARIQVQFRPELQEDVKGRLLARLAEDLHARIGLHFDCEEWAGASLLGDAPDGIDPSSLKIKRWADSRPSSLAATTTTTANPTPDGVRDTS
jgi:phenylacetate-CoA ligase